MARDLRGRHNARQSEGQLRLREFPRSGLGELPPRFGSAIVTLEGEHDIKVVRCH